MRANRDYALTQILLSEGPEVNYRDPGGASKYGVTRITLGEYLGRAATIAEVEQMTPDMAKAVYTKLWMAPLRFDDLSSGVDYRLLDLSINNGVTGGISILELALGRWPVTGNMSDDVFKAASAVPAKQLIAALSASWISGKFARANAWPQYGHGWSNRNARVTAQCMAMVV